MRITALETGNSRVQKAQFRLARAITGVVPGLDGANPPSARLGDRLRPGMT